jgi:hypothetical protein
VQGNVIGAHAAADVAVPGIAGGQGGCEADGAPQAFFQGIGAALVAA